MPNETRSIIQDLAKSILHRIDAWGVTFIIAFLALLIHQVVTLSNIILVITITIMYWLGFFYNDYCDAPFDARDEAKSQTNFFVKHPVSKVRATWGILAITAIFLLLFAPYDIKGILLLAVYYLIMGGYSARPLRFKSRPGVDLLTHAFIIQTYPYLMCLVLINVTWTPIDYALLVINFLSSLCGQLEQQFRDFEIDSLTDTNFATTVGKRLTRQSLQIATAVLCFLGIITIATGVIHPILVPFGLITLPTILYRLNPQQDKPRSRRVVHSSVVMALFYTVFMISYWFKS